MKKITAQFEQQFKKYFSRLVDNGEAKVNPRVNTQKVKGITKTMHSLEIKVNFGDKNALGNWNEFSVGQKTVLAICIVLAIQKCEPTPFCVLDEVDAALDSQYARKLADIIVVESQDCQYWLTSFKKDMLLAIPETAANFYHVHS